MSSTKKPPRHTEAVVATMLYFRILGVDVKVVAKLVELKHGTAVSPETCEERLGFHALKLSQQNLSWTPAGVGRYIAGITTRDIFNTITVIDGECEKQSNVQLAVLKDEYNEARVAFEKRLKELAQVAESKAAGGLKYVDPSGPQPWRNDADDPVLSWETLQPWPPLSS